MKAMILAAGLGTRLKPLTDKKPKALVEVLNRPMLDYAISYLVKYNINGIIINVHHLADQIIDFVEVAKRKYNINIEISDERDALLDTGGGLKKASWFFEKEESFVLSAVDIFTNMDLGAMIQFHEKNKSLVTLAVKDRESSRSLMFDAKYELAGWKDNRTGEEIKIKEEKIDVVCSLGFSVIHVISPRIFKLFTETGAFSIVDAYLRLAKENKIVGFRHDQDNWMEFGRIRNFEFVNKNPQVLDFVDW